MAALLAELGLSTAVVLGVVILVTVTLLVAMFVAVRRGEGFEIESHWGGLGGGLGGWRVSAPLVYLFGVVAVLALGTTAVRPSTGIPDQPSAASESPSTTSPHSVPAVTNG